MVTVTGAEPAIRWSAVAAVAVVAGIAGWVSYVHAYDVIRSHGETGLVGRVYPGTVDGLIYRASMILLDSARRGSVPRSSPGGCWLLASARPCSPTCWLGCPEACSAPSWQLGWARWSSPTARVSTSAGRKQESGGAAMIEITVTCDDFSIQNEGVDEVEPCQILRMLPS